MKTAVIFDYGFGNLHSAKKAFVEAGFATEISNQVEICQNADLLVIPGVGAFSACFEGFKKNKGIEIVKARLERKRPIFGICVGFQILFEKGHEVAAVSFDNTDGECETDGKSAREKGGKSAVSGLNLLPGEVEKLPFQTSPHMGWNLGAARAVQTETFSPASAHTPSSDALQSARDIPTSMPQAVSTHTPSSETLQPSPARDLKPGTPPKPSRKHSNFENAFFYFVHSFGVLAENCEALKKWSEKNDGEIWVSENQGTAFVSAVFSPLISGTQFHPEKSGERGIALLKSLVD